MNKLVVGTVVLIVVAAGALAWSRPEVEALVSGPFNRGVLHLSQEAGYPETLCDATGRSVAQWLHPTSGDVVLILPAGDYELVLGGPDRCFVFGKTPRVGTASSGFQIAVGRVTTIPFLPITPSGGGR